jgi:flagellar basal body rod protein FlgG
VDTLYISASGMIAQNQNLALIAGNLANSQSPGYLAQVGTFTAFPTGTLIRTGSNPGVLGQSSSGVAFSAGIDMGDGGVEQTSNPNDLAIAGNNGFFVVRTANGLAYTRDGQFSVDAKGNLVTSQGDFVLDQAGKPIQLKSGEPFTVSATGVISQGNTAVATLALTDLSATGLTALGNDLYTSPTRLPFTGQVVQSSLNTSNVDLAQSMTQMIDAQAWYQSLTQVASEESKRLATTATLGMLS